MLILFVSVAAGVGAVVCWLVVLAVFGAGSLPALLGATAVWVVLAAVLICAALLASAAFDAVAGAAGVGVGAYFLLTLLAVLPQLAHYTPAGLLSVVNAVAAETQEADGTLWWPVVTGLALAGALLASAVWVFRRRELQ